MVDAIDTSILDLNDAFAAEDEATFRVKIEEIINQTVGEKNAQLYKDWNGDTRVSDPGDGYGLLGQVDQGYAAQTISHVQFAAQSADATQNIQTHSEHIIVCVNNITGWSEQILELAIRLQDMPFGAEMEPLVAEVLSLSNNMLYGADTNGNGLIEPVIGEGGADTAYEHAYYLTDMPLLPGAHRIPPPAQIP
jgi:hypothetical protein